MLPPAMQLSLVEILPWERFPIGITGKTLKRVFREKTEPHAVGGVKPSAQSVLSTAIGRRVFRPTAGGEQSGSLLTTLPSQIARRRLWRFASLRLRRLIRRGGIDGELAVLENSDVPLRRSVRTRATRAPPRK